MSSGKILFRAELKEYVFQGVLENGVEKLSVFAPKLQRSWVKAGESSPISVPVLMLLEDFGSKYHATSNPTPKLLMDGKIIFPTSV